MSQAQDSLVDQLRRVIKLANAAGEYDAADFIERLIEPSTIKLDNRPNAC